LELAEGFGNPFSSRSFSHESLPGSLPVVRFPLRLDQLLGGRPVVVQSPLEGLGVFTPGGGQMLQDVRPKLPV